MNKRDEICAELVKGMNDINGEAYDSCRKGWDACLASDPTMISLDRYNELTSERDRYRDTLKKIADYTIWDKATMVSAAKEALLEGTGEKHE